jgi:hypothetical protein
MMMCGMQSMYFSSSFVCYNFNDFCFLFSFYQPLAEAVPLTAYQEARYMFQPGYVPLAVEVPYHPQWFLYSADDLPYIWPTTPLPPASEVTTSDASSQMEADNVTETVKVNNKFFLLLHNLHF